MRKWRCILAFFSACVAVCVPLNKASAELPLTRAPILYLIDYRDIWFTNPAYANLLKDCPPDVVHVGKAVPITHIWGPIPCLAGENQQTGTPGQALDRNAIRLLSPDEIDKRIQTIKAGVTRLHELGVKEVYPYICSTTIAGSPDTREGFWNFYDHWDAYAKYVGPKPPEDPITWTVRDAKGNFATYYGKLSPSYFAPLNRYLVCKANANWLQYESRLVQLVAQCGYDGIFTDNTGPDTDYCKYCQAMFKDWSAKNYTPERLKQLTKLEDMADTAKVMRTLPRRELEKFRIFVCQNYLTTLRQAGQKVNPKFKIFPNSGQYENCIPVSEACDMYMFESPFSPGMQGDNPALADGLITVGPKGAGAAQLLTQKCAYSDPIKSVDTSMVLSCPRSCQTGEPQTFVLKVTTVGSGDTDGDAAEDFHLLLTDESGRSVRLDFQPRIAIGGTDLKDAVRPPQELKATWTPDREGSYRVTLGYRYTDLDHKDTTTQLAITQPFWPDKPYHTHIAGLQYLMFSEARLIFYDYEAVAKGRDLVQELWMAELAAFSRGGTIATTPAPRSKYGRFFRANAGLWENLRPCGQAGLLFAYWGTNQGDPRQGPNDRTVADYLSQRHILAVPLLDRKLQGGDLAGLRVIYAVAKEYEMTPPQVAVMRNFVASGGTLVLGEPDAKINGKPVAEALAVGGRDTGDEAVRKGIVEWNWIKPVVPVAPISPSQDLLAGVRFAAYVAGEDKPSRLILHAVNFNVKLDKQPHLSKKFDTVSVDLPLPVGTQVAAARAYDPDADMANLKFQNKPGRVLLDIPDLHIYKVVEIVLEPAGGQK